MTPSQKQMSYADIIERIMLKHGYHASLQFLYREFWNHMDRSQISAKDPEAIIREKAQRDRRFERIGLGVYALRDYMHKLPQPPLAKTAEEKTHRRHADIQGMLIEIGNNRPEVKETYTNDRGFVFGNKKLGNLATLSSMPRFTYKPIVDGIRYVDVAWFNERNFPAKIFEVEHTTDFRGALVKFCELQDFQTQFCCIAEGRRQDKFQRELDRAAFAPIRKRCEFFSYEQVEKDYETALRKVHI